jgi:hypothetical protein
MCQPATFDPQAELIPSPGMACPSLLSPLTFRWERELAAILEAALVLTQKNKSRIVYHSINGVSRAII